ncbi:MAG: fructosamine kinase family protein [Flavobacteriales bacterium]|nr:fructosamine kinase family protein [Flavobacteriales bacterium]
MKLDTDLIDCICGFLQTRADEKVRIEHVTAVNGGSINDAFRLDTSEGRYFLKLNAADRYPSMFEAEADGLKRLREANALRVPHVIAFGEAGHHSYLLLEWIGNGVRNRAFWESLGSGLAGQHAHSADRFGLDRDNYIGSLKQVNAQHSKWSEFLIGCRLEPMARMARDLGRLDMADALRLERLYTKLDTFFPTEAPALLHGDLWIGNVICDTRNKAALVDPAAHFGHREMDIAMTRLFGGFDPAFFSAYQTTRPLEAGWEERLPVAQLYPILVHTALFGGGYASDARAIIRRFA